MVQPSISKSRWGLLYKWECRLTFYLSERFDVTLMLQYMIHLTKELEVEGNEGNYEISTKNRQH